MKILVACEKSGIVRNAFASMGHYVVSCDIEPSERPGSHYQGDVFDIINEGWDLLIAHPPCTYLCSSGLHWNKRYPARNIETEKALEFVRRLFAAPIRKKAIENPVGRISTAIKPATQYIQPYNFGENASKKTGLWLENLPPLIDTLHIPGRIVEYPPRSGKMVERWANQTDSGQNKLPPSKDRGAIRSATYPGIAAAMAEQWGR